MSFCLFQVIFAFTAVAYGRPEAGFSSGGYSAPGPSSSYNAPSNSYSPPSNSYSPPSGNYGAPAPQYGAPPQQPVIHKHVYVHVPPPEQEYPAAQKVIPVAPAQKHYKIIFIKVKTPNKYFHFLVNYIYVFVGTNCTNSNCASNSCATTK